MTTESFETAAGITLRISIDFRYRLKEKLRWILDATRQHSANLAKFVFIYKLLTKLLGWSEGKTREFHSAMAAFLGGYLVFGKRTSVNEQVSSIKSVFQ